MNKIITTIFFLLMVGISINAQDAIRYQGVALDANSEIIPSSDIAILFSILKDSPTGDFAYIERQETTTSESGHFELEIGRGMPIAGSFSNVDWTLGSYYLEVSIDPTGGTNYILAGATEFLSVPYALHATEALNGPRGQQGPQGPQGQQGPQGEAGPQGLPGLDVGDCWDLNGNGINDPEEDNNSDGIFSAADCQGAVGPEGPRGPNGQNGAQGPKGVKGIDAPSTGVKGPQGIQGPQGPPGPGGGIKGQKGPQGPQGIQGPQGPQGDQGPQGPQGGTEGVAGPAGDPGPPGDPNGPQGVSGLNGSNGPQGPQGAQGPQGITGSTGLGIQRMLAVAPLSPSQHDIYLDSGANRADGNPGFRYYNGSTWIDLY